MLLPAFFAYAFASPTKLIGRTALFYAGLLLTLVPLGVLAGVFGSFVSSQRELLILGAAIVVIVIGMLQIMGVRFPGTSRGGAAEGTSAVSVFVLGSVYGVAGVCAGPILGSVLSVAAVSGSAAYGGIMLAIFALGMVVPLGILAATWSALKLGQRGWLRPRMLKIGRWQNSWWAIGSGVLSIAIGVVLIVTDGTAGIGGILTIDAQYAAESWVATTGSHVPNIVFGVAAVVMLGLAALLYQLRARRIRLRSPRAEHPDAR
jgi:cytochrome c biogenesis protein CcdA